MEVRIVVNTFQRGYQGVKISESGLAGNFYLAKGDCGIDKDGK